MIITQTPLRLSFLGGNTDFPKYYLKHGGAVLATAINKYVYCIIKSRFDDEIRLNYSIKEKVLAVDDIQHELVREAMRLVGVKKRVEITFLSDIPSEGSGLGSSSSVTVGVLNALHNFVGENVGAKQLAEEACLIERVILKKPIGVQDQYIAAFGGLNLLEFGKDIKVTPIHLTDTIRADLEKAIMMFYTNRTRKSESILAKMKLNTRILNRNKELAFAGREAIKKGDIFALGAMMNDYWQLKKKLNPLVSNSSIDQMYETAITAGACGGKILGAGGGGFLAVLVPEDKKMAVREAMDTQELPFGFSKSGSKVIFDYPI